MVQFKEVFLGNKQLGLLRAASSQKCMRVSGKHNDLETVGRTARHHTFFEMLGNFSFGDYFKEGAIAYSWEFLTRVLNLPENRLWVTIFQEDDEAFRFWHKKIGLPSQRIIRMDEKDNFWAMGETGPCGPCSEIHIDQGAGVGCGLPSCNIACDCDRFLELWNLVFMQYQRDSSNQLTPLPKPSVDTGMGLERLTAIMQGQSSNFSTDLLRPIIAAIEELTEKEYGSNPEWDISFRVIADHLRALTFLISDGVIPSNEGRGYVLRRLIRRASRHGRNLLLKEPFLYKAAGIVVDLMRDTYPELENSRNYIARLLLQEEDRFSHTLDYGIKVLYQVMEDIQGQGKSVIPGQEVFKLYDTFGFPLDITQEIAQEKGFSLDLAGFEKAMAAQRELARQSWKGTTEIQVKPIYQKLAEEVGKIKFIGYQTLQAKAPVIAIIQGEDLSSEATTGETVEIILAETPFYAEAGGQLGDVGTLGDGDIYVEVADTQTPLPGLICHQGMIKKGKLKKGMWVEAVVDQSRREALTHSHSATHLLQAALREILGDHVKQAGSLVAPDRLRFDFTHFSPLTEREKRWVEELVNEKIWDNLPVITEIMSLEEAIEQGATALFGEKYDLQVRVVQMGNFSKEVCGGTHTKNTASIRLFKIISEGGIAAGIRRIEALTGQEAYKYILKEEDTLGEVRELIKARPFEEVDKVRRLLEQAKGLEKELARLKEKIAGAKVQDLDSYIIEVQGIKVLAIEMANLDLNALRNFVDTAKSKLKSGVIVAATVTDGKVALVGGVTKDLTSQLHAGELIKRVAAIVGGSGGGRADMAQAGGKDVSKVKEALAKVKELVETSLKENKD
jgi:alanyl-tRNA synthetase